MRGSLAARFASLSGLSLVVACASFGADEDRRAEDPPRVAAADAGQSPEAGLADAQPGSSCASTPGAVFCSDFEAAEQGASPFGWSDATLAPGSVFSVEAGVGVGGSRGLHLKVDPQVPVSSMNTWLRRALGSTDMTRTFTLELDVRVAQMHANYGILSALWFFPDPQPVLVGVAGGDGPFLEGVEDPASSYTGGPVLGVWHRVVSKVTPSPDGPTRSVTVDGVIVATGPVRVMNPLAPADVRIGFYYAGSTTSLDAYFDNVVVRIE